MKLSTSVPTLVSFARRHESGQGSLALVVNMLNLDRGAFFGDQPLHASSHHAPLDGPLCPWPGHRSNGMTSSAAAAAAAGSHGSQRDGTASSGGLSEIGGFGGVGDVGRAASLQSNSSFGSAFAQTVASLRGASWLFCLSCSADWSRNGLHCRATRCSGRRLRGPSRRCVVRAFCASQGMYHAVLPGNCPPSVISVASHRWPSCQQPLARSGFCILSGGHGPRPGTFVHTQGMRLPCRHSTRIPFFMQW